MNNFVKTIDNAVFNFKTIQERDDNVFLVSVENHSFRMICDEEGMWFIWQQVPAWIKDLEEQLGNAIEEQFA
jgi:hypothetical protein